MGLRTWDESRRSSEDVDVNGEALYGVLRFAQNYAGVWWGEGERAKAEVPHGVWLAC
jgi:hypothetical protein